MEKMEIVQNCLKLDFFWKDDNENSIKQQSTLTFNGIHNSYKIFESYTFKQNQILMHKPISLVSAVLEFSKLLMSGHIMTNYSRILDKKKFSYFI